MLLRKFSYKVKGRTSYNVPVHVLHDTDVQMFIWWYSSIIIMCLPKHTNYMNNFNFAVRSIRISGPTVPCSGVGGGASLWATKNYCGPRCVLVWPHSVLAYTLIWIINLYHILRPICAAGVNTVFWQSIPFIEYPLRMNIFLPPLYSVVSLNLTYVAMPLVIIDVPYLHFEYRSAGT